MRLRIASADDAAAIAAIYAHYVTATAVSFETEPPTEEDIRARIGDSGALYPWLVAEDGERQLLGYAYAAAFRSRRAYRFSVETTAYLDPAAIGRGIGRRLYAALIPLLERQGFTQAIAAITLPNEPSVGLHETFGFVRAGVYRDVGYKLGDWRSVGLWQRALAPLKEPPEEPRPFARFWADGESAPSISAPPTPSALGSSPPGR